MFSEKDIRLYKSIQAPDTLKEKVLARSAEVQPKKPRRHFAGTALIAACLALALVSLFPAGSPAIHFEGQRIGASPIAVSSEAQAQYGIRTAVLSPTVVELEIPKDTEISASHGETERTAENALRWILPPDVTEATLTVTRKNNSTLYFLHAGADGVWYMEKK